MGDGYYDYYDDYGYGDEAGGQVDAEEEALATKYAEGKSYMSADTELCIQLLREVLEEDAAHGRWTFKARKMLTRASRLAGRYDEMMAHYAAVTSFSHADVPPEAVCKAMRKALDEGQRLPPEQRARLADATLLVAERDTQLFGEVFYSALMTRVGAGAGDAMADLARALQWCRAGDPRTVAQRAPQLYAVYAALIAAYDGAARDDMVADTYYRALEVRSQAVRRRLVGTVMEYGGYMFMRHGDWGAACEALLRAARLQDGAGAPAPVGPLRMLALAAVLDGRRVDIFAAAEVEPLMALEETRAFAQLHRAYAAADLKAFLAAAEAVKQGAAAADGQHGPDVAPFLPLCTQRARADYLVRFSTNFSSVRLSQLEEELHLDRKATVQLCTFCILHGLIAGRLDLVNGFLLLHSTRASSELKRAAALQKWSQSIGLEAAAGVRL